MRPSRVVAALLGLGAALPPGIADAYIGPGAGFAFVGSFLVIFLLLLLAPLMALYSLARFFVLALLGRRAYRAAHVDRVVVLGLDGLDPVLAEAMMDRGELPSFARLRASGGYRRLQTTFPAISPVAWSTFQTGVNPGKHNIFDFLSRDPRTYLPDLSSARVAPPRRSLRLGKLRLPLGKPQLRLLRKSRPFWVILGKKGIFSTILRVPITFPPEPFYGLSLSAMCVPDLKGTQGTFTLFSTEELPSGVAAASPQASPTGGVRVRLERLSERSARGAIPGPINTMSARGEELSVPFVATVGDDGKHVSLAIARTRPFTISVGTYSEWVTLAFRPGLGITVSGVAMFLVLAVSPHIRIYMTPIHIDPHRPALPISHPAYYAVYLAKLHGTYATLGLAEDTWALSEGVIDSDAFLRQTYAIHGEREAMFFSALDRTRRGVCAVVFDTSDRIQHMFWRGLERDHPANAGRRPDAATTSAISDLYKRMDDLLGRTLARLADDPRTVLFVMSDHGFKSFRRGLNVNAWLRREGFLMLRDGQQPGDWFANVDWPRTRAYGLGLGGIYLNLAGREAQGIVATPDDARRVREDIRARLRGLVDPLTGEVAVRDVFDSREIYSGPYVTNAPDLIVGYGPNYRVSWGSATGNVAGEVFEDNHKAWSGDHCINPQDVPGILFCNRPIDAARCSIQDLAPTILALFGVAPPAYMDGTVLMDTAHAARNRRGAQ